MQRIHVYDVDTTAPIYRRPFNNSAASTALCVNTPSEGVQATYMHNTVFAESYSGGEVDYAAGLGGGGSAMTSYTWSDGSQSDADAPGWLKNALDAAGGREDCSCSRIVGFIEGFLTWKSS
jgi:hypothetical protein